MCTPWTVCSSPCLFFEVYVRFSEIIERFLAMEGKFLLIISDFLLVKYVPPPLKYAQEAYLEKILASPRFDDLKVKLHSKSCTPGFLVPVHLTQLHDNLPFLKLTVVHRRLIWIKCGRVFSRLVRKDENTVVLSSCTFRRRQQKMVMLT